MRLTGNVLRVAALAALVGAVACSGGDQITEPVQQHSPGSLQKVIATTVSVSNVEQLYAAVNNAANAGADILLAPGTYVLSATGLGGARPNGGRLDLQQDMSLYGVTGDRSAVVIDASALQASSYTVSFGRTGPVRIGRGTNTVEWLTVISSSAAAAGIAGELTGTATTNLRVAHILAEGASRGIDLRNSGATMIGRRIIADVVDNELIGPTDIVGMSEGIRLANFVGANQGAVVATLSGNRAHGFQIGLIIASNRSSNATIDVSSSGDRFFGNTLGALITGGLTQTSGVANSNVTNFEAHGTQFVDNTLDIPGIDGGGVRFVAGLSTTTANAASNNTLNVAMWGSKSTGNEPVNFEAYGAWKTALPGIAGTNNHATIKLYGVSKQLDGIVMPSFPLDVGGTNSVTVIR